MTCFKRFSFVFFTVEDDQLLDLAALLSGRYCLAEKTSLFVLSPLTSSKYTIDLQDLEMLLKIPAKDWTPESELSRSGAEFDWLEAMARKGVVLSDDSRSPFTDLRRKAEILFSEQWHPYAALFHFMSRGQKSGYRKTYDYAAVEEHALERANKFLAEHGPPPDPFVAIPGTSQVKLPLIDKKGDLYRSLMRRKTTRAFDTGTKVDLANISTLLQYVFGCQGYFRLSPEILLLHRTSPSGGSRHPIEVYPLMLRVNGLATGLYHYNWRNHSLELMQEYNLSEAQMLATKIAAGQEYAGTAHVIFIMTARYYRNHWKYRRKSRTYGVILMDAAHLSQTFYLVGTDLNLGTFYTAAINAPKADDILGLDGFTEGTIAVCGCGIKPSADTSDQGLDFQRYIPRETEL